ncbi:hypothetical protein G6514_009447 [Epicoccum nigrum]|nr:hypothetical protein G6514_009447 [Epicoccum nigrum]
MQVQESSALQQNARQREDEIEELRDKVQTLEADKQSLVMENGNLRTKAFGNEHKAARLNRLTELLHEMSSSSETRYRFSSTLIVDAMAIRGINLAEFGIDRARFETYLKWASDVLANNTNALNPTDGFRGPGLLLKASTEGGEDVSGVSIL